MLGYINKMDLVTWVKVSCMCSCTGFKEKRHKEEWVTIFWDPVWPCLQGWLLTFTGCEGQTVLLNLYDLWMVCTEQTIHKLHISVPFWTISELSILLFFLYLFCIFFETNKVLAHCTVQKKLLFSDHRGFITAWHSTSVMHARNFQFPFSLCEETICQNLVRYFKRELLQLTLTGTSAQADSARTNNAA